MVDYFSKATMNGIDMYYYRLPEDSLRALIRKCGYIDYTDAREATIYFRDAQPEKVTIYSSLFESSNSDLVIGNIERIVLDDGKSLEGKNEKKSLWQKLLGR